MRTENRQQIFVTAGAGGATAEAAMTGPVVAVTAAAEAGAAVCGGAMGP